MTVDMKSPSATLTNKDTFLSTRTGFVMASWLFFTAYTLSMPFVSNWANNRWWNTKFYDSTVCDTPAHFFKCANGEDFTELALKYRGKAVGCGCGQGYLGEALCPLYEGGYTLSGFITTTPGTGAFVAFSALPITSMYYFQDAMHVLFKPQAWLKKLNSASLISFQITLGWFLISSACTFPSAHMKGTICFVVSLMVHLLVSAWIAASHSRTRTARIIMGCSVFGLVVTLIGIIPGFFPSLNRGFGSYMFWLGEALGLSSILGTAPLAVAFGDIDVYNALHIDRDLSKVWNTSSNIEGISVAGPVAQDRKVDGANEHV